MARNLNKKVCVVLAMLSAAFLLLPQSTLQSSILEPGNIVKSKPAESLIPPGKGLLYLKAATFDPLLEEPKILAELKSSTPNRYWIVQFAGPVQERWKEALVREAASLLDYVPDYGFITRMDENTKERVAAMPFVRAVMIFQPAYKLEPQLLEKTGRVKVNILMFSSKEPGSARQEVSNRIATLKVISFIEGRGGEIIKSDSNIIEASIPSSLLKELAFVPEVQWIEEKYDFKDCLDVARAATGAESLHGTVNSSASANPVVLGLGGKDVIIAVMDGGLRTTHQDFNEPPSKMVAFLYGAQNTAMEHGTLVTGCAVGDGSANGASTRLYRGTAPNAKFVFQRRWASDTTTPGLLTCFKDAYNYGARIHTNSWLLAEKDKQVNRYGSYSQIADIGVRDADLDVPGEQPLIITWASGNEAGATVGEPATAKNVITVGATDDQGTATTTDDALASWSSQGPTRDGRLKPDVVAPGTKIYTTDDYSDTSYVSESGTSLSTPIVAGACAIVIEDYKARLGIMPSPALIKALLINRATPVPGYPWPGVYQGWGQVNLTQICTKWDSIYFDDQSTELNTDETKTYYVKPASGTLRINLVWTDAYGLVNAEKVLVNDLDLIVKAPNGTIYWGNDFTAPYNDARDSLNNVEGVIISNPDLTGAYEITVKGVNIPKGPQDFALVVSNALEGSGKVSWVDKNEFGYYKAGSAKIRVYDKDLNTDSGLQETTDRVRVYSETDPSGLTLTCTEEGTDSALFSATITFTETGGSSGTNLLVSSGDIVTVEYNESSPVQLYIYDNATYDSAPPTISNIFISNIKPASAVIHFWTDEPAEARLWIKDNSTGNWSEDDSAGIHYHPAETCTKSHIEYILTSWRSCLKPNTEYWLQVNATDKAGNKAINDNSGNYYRFKTPEQEFKILFVDDDFKGGCGYWFSYTLNLTGYYHDYYRVPSGTSSGPSSATLTNYDIVVWDCGVAGQKSEWGDSLTLTDRSSIGAYLDTPLVGAMDEKPRLLVLGWGVAQEVNAQTGGPAFLSNYLHCTYNGDYAGLDMTGVAGDVLGDNLTADVGYDSLTDYWNYGDDISADNNGIKSFDWDGSADAACVRYGTYNTTNQTVFLPVLWAFFDYFRDGKEVHTGTDLEFQRRVFEDYFYAPLTSISGWVKDIHGEPIRDAVVHAVDPAKEALVLGAAYTNDSGYYKIKWLTGGMDYKVIGLAPDAPSQVYDHGSYKPVTAIAQQTVPNINFTLTLRNDTGVQAITNPVDNETYPLGILNIDATVKNYGSAAQANFDAKCEITRNYTPAGAVYFSDDFEDGDAVGWTVASGTWSVELDGSNYVYKQTTTDATIDYSTASGTFSNYTYEARVKIVSSFGKGGRPALVFRWQDTDNFYIFRIVGPGSQGNTTDLIKNVGGLLGTLGTALFTPTVGQWYTLKVTAQGSTIKCYIDDKLVITAVDDKFASGKIGLSCNEGECWFDDVWVNETVELITERVYSNKKTITESLALNATKALEWSYDFAQEGEYTIVVKTLLAADKNELNDEKSIRIVINANASFIYELKKGWNYICLTFNNATLTKASDLASAIGTNCTHIRNWTGGGFVTYVHATGENNFTLSLGRGYFVYVSSATTFMLTGSSIPSATLSLEPGWNSIGRFSAILANASALAANIENCTAVAYWDDTLGRFITHPAETNVSNFNLERGKGYFVYVTKASTWENK